ncbi:MAG: hypothetical protein IJX36_06210, partial [Thermoguttaceae bacterium]|nr:hypothetical protein [Thermoguttaceae bacterium]
CKLGTPDVCQAKRDGSERMSARFERFPTVGNAGRLPSEMERFGTNVGSIRAFPNGENAADR